MKALKLVERIPDVDVSAEVQSWNGRLQMASLAPSGVKKLRELVLNLAICGKLTQNPSRSGWKKDTFESIGEWGSGGTPLKGNADYYGGDIPWLVIGDLNDGIVTASQNKITRAGLENSSAKIVPPNTLLVAMYGSIGKLGISGIECATNQAIAFCKVDESKIRLHYLFNFIRAIRGQLISRGQGLAQQNISQKVLKSVEVMLPSLAEQDAINFKVNELMALCDRLEAQKDDAAAAHEVLVKTLLGTLTQSQTEVEFQDNWHRIAQHFNALFTTESSIEELKKTILQLAVMGKLVPQDPNDEPASKLFKTIKLEKDRLVKEGKIKKDKPLLPVAGAEKPHAIPNNWEWVRMQEVFDVRDGTHDTPKYTQENGVPLITSKDFCNGKINFDSARLISTEDHNKIKQRSKVDKGDILFSMIGGNIGNQVIVETDVEFSIKNVALYKYYNRTLTIPEYLKIVLMQASSIIQAQASGGAQPFVSLGFLRGMLFPLPPRNEQLRIIAAVEELMDVCDTLKDGLAKHSALHERLAEALITKAIT